MAKQKNKSAKKNKSASNFPPPTQGASRDTEVSNISHVQDAMQNAGARNTSSIVIGHHTFFNAPIPSPEDLQKYEKICSGTADRLLGMVEKEQNIRKEAGERYDSHTVAIIANQTKTQYIGGVVAFGLLGVAGLAIWKGYPWFATLSIIGFVGSAIRILIDWMRKK